MASLQGYMDGSYDYKQMYNIKDIRGPLPKPVIHKNTLLDALHSNPKCLEFARMVMSLPDMSAKFNNSQANFTVFVPLSDMYLPSNDSYHVRQLILLHTLEHAYTYQFLASSRMMWLNTRLPGTKLLIENLGTPRTMINRHAQILGQQMVGNAVIYFIDQSLRLDENPLASIDI